jgi:hypothetical protein
VKLRLAAAVGVAVLVVALLAVAIDHRSAGKTRPERPAVVVVLILDEFPLDSLLVPGEKIDPARFPNFARLAGTSTWYEHATTVYDSTFKAVPSILDATLPVQGSKPDARSHKKNVFTLFHRLGYGIVDVESAEALCVPSICAGHRMRRPGVLARLNHGGRPARLHRWIRSIRPRPGRTLYLQHALLPHEPWIYLPSGHQSRPAGNDPVEDINDPRGFHDPDLSLHNHARYMLQLGYVDRQIGILMDQLKRKGLWDKALLAVTADHGYAFQLGIPDRRKVIPSNIDKIAPVVLFVKQPGQHEGKVDRTYVHNIDVVPTLADALGARLDWRHEGRSLLRPRPATREVSMVSRDFKSVVRIDTRTLEQRRAGQRAHWAKVFLTGAESRQRFGDPFASIYRLGPNADMLDRRVGDVPQASDTARIANARLWLDVSPSKQITPTRVTGELFGGPGHRIRRDLAASVNGRIRAVGRSFYLDGSPREFFSLLVPESSLHTGHNRVELLQVLPGEKLERLASGP